MDYAKESLRLHGEWKGKIEMVTRVPVKTKDDLSLAYTPLLRAASATAFATAEPTLGSKAAGMM